MTVPLVGLSNLSTEPSPSPQVGQRADRQQDPATCYSFTAPVIDET